MNTTYVVVAVVLVAVLAAAAVFYLAQTAVPSAEMDQLPDVEQEIGADVLPSEEELNIEVNDVTLELPEEI